MNKLLPSFTDRETPPLHPSRLFLIASLSLLAVTCARGQWPGLMPMQLRSSGSYLGLGLRDIDAGRAKALKLTEVSGVEIVAVEEREAGDEAGIRPGDVVLSYNGERILGAQQLIRLVSETPSGRHVRIECWRGGDKKEITVTTGVAQTATLVEKQDTSVRRRITEIPYPMMIWRNLILGIDSESLSEQLAETVGVKQGILVWEVSEGSPAQRAGLRAGDVVTGFCGRTIQSPREVGIAMQQLHNSQRPMSLSVMRDHKPISLSLSLESAH